MTLQFGTTDHGPIEVPDLCFCCVLGTGCGWTGPRQCDPAGVDLYVSFDTGPQSGSRSRRSFTYDATAGVSSDSYPSNDDYIVRRDCRSTGGNAIQYFDENLYDNCYSAILPTTLMPSDYTFPPSPTPISKMIIYRNCDTPLDQLQLYCPFADGYSPISWFYVHEIESVHGSTTSDFLEVRASKSGDGELIRGPVSNTLQLSCTESSVHLERINGAVIPVGHNINILSPGLSFTEGGFDYFINVTYDIYDPYFHPDTPCSSPKGWMLRLIVRDAGFAVTDTVFFFKPKPNVTAADIFDPFDITLPQEFYARQSFPAYAVPVTDVFPNATAGACSGSTAFKSFVASSRNDANSVNYWTSNETMTLTDA